MSSHHVNILQDVFQHLCEKTIQSNEHFSVQKYNKQKLGGDRGGGGSIHDIDTILQKAPVKF